MNITQAVDRNAIYSSIRNRMEAVGFVFEKEQRPHMQNRQEMELKFEHPMLVQKIESFGRKVRGKKFYLKPLSSEHDCEIGIVNGLTSALIGLPLFPNPNAVDSYQETPAWTNKTDDHRLDRLLIKIAEFCSIKIGGEDDLTPAVPPLSEELASNVKYREGATKTIVVNGYERNAAARNACVAHYGSKCFICDFDFGSEYGIVAEGYIHVHHLRPIAECDKEYLVDPIADLRPVCPNCHAVIHLGGVCRSISEIKELREAQYGR